MASKRLQHQACASQSNLDDLREQLCLFSEKYISQYNQKRNAKERVVRLSNMASRQHSVATGVDNLAEEIYLQCKSTKMAGVKQQLQQLLDHLRIALLEYNVQEISKAAASVTTETSNNRIRISDGAKAWLVKLENIVHKESMETSSDVVDEAEDLSSSYKRMSRKSFEAGQLETKENELKQMQSLNAELQTELQEERTHNETLIIDVRDLSKNNSDLWAKYAEEKKKHNQKADETRTLKEAMTVLQTENNERLKRLREQGEQVEAMQSNITKLRQELADRSETSKLLTEDIEELATSRNELYSKLQEERKKNKQETEEYENQIGNMRYTIAKLTGANKDLANRYSQVPSAQLKDKNPDIVDLSDPNRAMKLGERYGQLYNDTWTDAFEAQQTLEVSDKEGIRNLLNVLKNSYDFCEQRAQKQLDGVISLLLYPCKDQEQHLSKGKGVLSQPRILSSNKKALLDIRRQVATVEGVKQAFLSHMHNIMETEKERSVMEASKEYYVKCVEICWLMVLHDPPLYMVMDVKPDTKVDPNLYSVLSKGDKVDYLVWPPLLNGRGGGLLQKGVVEVIKAGKKKASKPK